MMPKSANTTSDSKHRIYRWQGGRYDSTTGLYNFRHRDYSPTLGRWMQQDPIGYIDGANLYQAMLGAPIGNVDPMGLSTEGDEARCTGGTEGSDAPRMDVPGDQLDKLRELGLDLDKEWVGQWIRIDRVVYTITRVHRRPNGGHYEERRVPSNPPWVAGYSYSVWVPDVYYEVYYAPPGDTAAIGSGNAREALDAIQEAIDQYKSQLYMPYLEMAGMSALGGMAKIGGIAKGSANAGKSNAQLRREWEVRNGGQTWPKDPVTGRNQDVSHIRAKADGGPNTVDNIEPLPHGPHIQQHSDDGDFVRWGGRRRG